MLPHNSHLNYDRDAIKVRSFSHFSTVFFLCGSPIEICESASLTVCVCVLLLSRAILKQVFFFQEKRRRNSNKLEFELKFDLLPFIVVTSTMRGLQTFGAPLRRYLGGTPGQGQPPILKMKPPLAPRRKGPEVVHDPCDPPPESVPRFYPLALLLCIRGSSSCLRSYSTCDGTVCRHLCVSLLPSEPPGKPPGSSP